MKNNITELVFILDRSGSMAGLEADTVGGFNSMIEKQKKFGGKVYVSTILFSNESFVLHDRVPIEQIDVMRLEDFQPCGSTALLDAVGGALKHIDKVHKYIRKEDVPHKTIFAITTDGMENASIKYNYKTVREMLTKCEKEKGWEFLFAAANIDAAEAAEAIGIRKSRAVRYSLSEKGTAKMYDAMSDAVYYCRAEKDCEDWGKDLEEKEYGWFNNR